MKHLLKHAGNNICFCYSSLWLLNISVLYYVVRFRTVTGQYKGDELIRGQTSVQHDVNN